MSVHVLGWALREAPVENKGDLLTLIVLADHAHDDGDGAFPSVETIARLARLSPRGVQKALRKLALAGLVKATPRAGRTTLYRVVMTPEASSGVNSVRSELGDAEGRTGRRKPPNPVRPNRKEPSSNREGHLADMDRLVIES